MRALLIAPDVCWPQARHGAAQRTELLRQALSRVSETELAVACISHSEDPPDHPHIAKVFCEPESPFVSGSRRYAGWRWPMDEARERVHRYYAVNKEIAEWVQARLEEKRYDFVVLRYLRSGAISGLLREKLGVPIFLDFDDVDWLKEASRIRRSSVSLKNRVAMEMQNRYRETLCRQLAGLSTHIWTASRNESIKIRPLRSEVLPNIPMNLPKIYSPPEGNNSTVLFVGLLNYTPNRHGVDWFIREVWSRVIQQAPQARFRVVGKGLDEETHSRWQAAVGVDVLGFVPDIADEYRRASVSVCPIFWGGGSNIKVLESLGYGRPCVVSRRVGEQFQGYFGPDSGVFACDDSKTFSRYILQLLTPNQATITAVRLGVKVLHEQFSFDHFASIVERDVVRVLSRDKVWGGGISS